LNAQFGKLGSRQQEVGGKNHHKLQRRSRQLTGESREQATDRKQATDKRGCTRVSWKVIKILRIIAKALLLRTEDSVKSRIRKKK
jgi:hypothetical protein